MRDKLALNVLIMLRRDSFFASGKQSKSLLICCQSLVQSSSAAVLYRLFRTTLVVYSRTVSNCHNRAERQPIRQRGPDT